MEIHEIGPFIREWRLKHYLSLTAMAEKTGLSGGAISGYEMGNHIPRPGSFLKLAAVITTLPVNDLLPKLKKHDEEKTAERLEKVKKGVARRTAKQRKELLDAAKEMTEMKKAVQSQPTPAPAPDPIEVRPATPPPRKKEICLTTGQQLAAISWAAKRAGMDYGTFMARRMCGLSQQSIFRDYWEFLEKRNKQKYEVLG